MLACYNASSNLEAEVNKADCPVRQSHDWGHVMVSQQADLFETDPSELDEDDLEVTLTNAVVTATDWTTETILSQLKRGNIELAPRFQRREAWTDSRKSAFIESLFMGLPIPQIVLAERQERRGSYIVVDGKQRLLSIRRFGVEGTDEEFAPLTLAGLKTRNNLNGESWTTMKGDPKFHEDISAYENQTIRTVVIRNWPDESFLYLVFLRLNTGGVPLSPQELRQALHPGPFTNFIDEHALESTSIQRALGLSGPDFRMRDVEILLRFFAFAGLIQEYRGNLKDFLDGTSQHFNGEWGTRQLDIEDLARQCDHAIDTTFDVFVENAFRRWVNGRFEGRFNRAVFDIMTYYFRDADIRTLAAQHADQIIETFKNLCETDREFTDSMRVTPKTTKATFTRLRTWGLALQEALSRELEIPNPDAGIRSRGKRGW